MSGVGEGSLTAAATSTIRRNSIHSNAGLGIDVDLDGLTQNDPGDSNGIKNFPVFTVALLAGGLLDVRGFARPGTMFDLYVADPDGSGFGEGRTYLMTLVEGSNGSQGAAADLDFTSGGYGPTVNGLSVGSDVTSRFRYLVPAPSAVTLGAALTG